MLTVNLKKKLIEFVPASVVPLDMDELSDSVVSGRFNAGSSAVCGAAAGVPDGLKGRDGDGSCKAAGSWLRRHAK